MRRFIVASILIAASACALTSFFTSRAIAQSDSFLGKPTGRWAAELSSTDPKVRRSAAFALGRIGAAALGSAGSLAERVASDPDPNVRDMAACALGDLIREVPASGAEVWLRAGSILEKALGNDSSPRVRRSVAYALGSFGATAVPAAAALREALASKDTDVRQNAAWAIGQLGDAADNETIAAVCGRLSDDTALVRRDAAGALGKIGPTAGERGVPALMELVQRETDEVVRKTGLDSLAHMAGKEHARYADALQKLLQDPDAETARGAALVLARIGGPSAIPAVPILRKALADDDVQVQRLVAAALANLDADAAPAVLDLATALNNAADTEVRRNAALAIGHMGKDGKPGVPALGAALDLKTPLEVRQFAAEALAKIAYPANAGALPQVIRAIQTDSDPLVRQRCVWALFAMDDIKKDGIDRVLEKVLGETDVNNALVRYDAARALANKLGPEAPNATVDVLMEMLNNRRLRVFKGTDAKVEGAGNEASSGTARVAESIGGDARYMAIQALGWMGEKASRRKDVVAALREAARETDPKMREQAQKSLKSLGIDS